MLALRFRGWHNISIIAEYDGAQIEGKYKSYSREYNGNKNKKICWCAGIGGVIIFIAKYHCA